MVMYHHDYGQMSRIGDSDTAVYFAHTGDNRGPQSAEEIRSLYRKIREMYPTAEVVPGTLEDVAEIALQQDVPVLTEEIGDTWIYGAGTDPGKMSQYRALLRLKNQLPENEMKKMYRCLLLIPEHSWEEQRQYLARAVEDLSPDAKRIAEKAMQECKRPQTDTEGWKPIEPEEVFPLADYRISVTKNGDIQIRSDFCPEMSVNFLYEVFSENEYKRFRSQYVTSDEIWAVEDFSKLGVDRAVDQYHRYETCNPRIWVKGNQIVVKTELPQEAVSLYDGMNFLELDSRWVIYPDGTIEVKADGVRNTVMPWLPRMGMELCLDRSFETVDYLGRGRRTPTSTNTTHPGSEDFRIR